jgi:hypothetical protein
MGGQAGGHGGRIAGAGLQCRQQTGQLLEVAQFVEREGKAGGNGTGLTGALGRLRAEIESGGLSALAGTAWIRFQEVWLGHGAAQDAAQVSNAILEVAAGVPFIARSAVPKHGSLVYHAAGFLVAQGAHCYWGASAGWLDADWAWRGEYDWNVGEPAAPATRAGAYAWHRVFARANVSIDVHAGVAEVTWANGTAVRGSR